MTCVGATGHQHLPTNAVPYLTAGVRAVVKSCAPPLRAVTSLALGADQLVAREALRLGATLHAVIPSAGYETTFSRDEQLGYQTLLAAADEVTRLDFQSPGEEAFWAAGRVVVDQCDLLIAIWDGQPARGLGGTADIVGYARDTGRDVRIIWPAGAVRS